MPRKPSIFAETPDTLDDVLEEYADDVDADDDDGSPDAEAFEREYLRRLR